MLGHIQTRFGVPLEEKRIPSSNQKPRNRNPRIARKESVKSWCGLRCWQGLHLHTVDDSVQHMGSQGRKKHVGNKDTSCCWKKISEFESLESSDSVQHNEGRSRKTTGQPEEMCGRCRSSSVRPDRFPPLFESGLVRNTHFRLQSWSRPVLPSRTLSTHHEVLDCGAAAAFQKLHFSLFTLIFFRLCVV